MAYPPTIPPATRVNATPQVDNHPADHNAISAALSAIVNELEAMKLAALLIGEVKLWPGVNVPNPNYMFCQGQQVSRTGLAALFLVLGTTYGAGDGSTTFTLPDYRDRSPAGAGGTCWGGVGVKGGEMTSSMPSHTHSGVDHLHSLNNHTHGNTTTASAAHGHNIGHGGELLYYGGGDFEIRAGDGVRFWAGKTAFLHDGADHVHGTGGPSNNSSGAADRSLTTGAAGSENGYSNYHPIQTINFIIRVS